MTTLFLALLVCLLLTHHHSCSFPNKVTLPNSNSLSIHIKILEHQSFSTHSIHPLKSASNEYYLSPGGSFISLNVTSQLRLFEETDASSYYKLQWKRDPVHPWKDLQGSSSQVQDSDSLYSTEFALEKMYVAQTWNLSFRYTEFENGTEVGLPEEQRIVSLPPLDIVFKTQEPVLTFAAGDAFPVIVNVSRPEQASSWLFYSLQKAFSETIENGYPVDLSTELAQENARCSTPGYPSCVVRTNPFSITVLGSETLTIRMLEEGHFWSDPVSQVFYIDPTEKAEKFYVNESFWKQGDLSGEFTLMEDSDWTVGIQQIPVQLWIALGLAAIVAAFISAIQTMDYVSVFVKVFFGVSQHQTRLGMRQRGYDTLSVVEERD